MELSPHKIKERLLKAIDGDYNVVDMAAVMEAINSLEKVTLSKELLEETRLGKYVNTIRKNTKNPDLARKTKNLVRKWRRFIVPDQNSQPHLNGDKNSVKTPSSANGSSEKVVKGFVQKPSQSATLLSFTSKPNSPVKVFSKTVSPACITFSSASNSPSSSMPGISNIVGGISPPIVRQRPFQGIGDVQHPISPALRQVPETLSRRNVISPVRLVSPNSIDSRSRSPLVTNNCDLSIASRNSPASRSALDLDKTNAANKRLRKDVISAISTEKTISFSVYSPAVSPNLVNGLSPPHTNSVVPNFDFNSAKRVRKRKADSKPEPMESLKKKLAIHAKTQKVKTTAQLIADLQAKTNSPLLKSSESILTDIRQEKDVDDLNHNNNINSTKNRAGKLCSFGDSVAEVKKSKSELMEKFLSSSPSPVPEIGNDVKVQKESPASSPASSATSPTSLIPVYDEQESTGDRYSVPVRPRRRPSVVIKEIMSSLPEVDFDAVSLIEESGQTESQTVVDDEIVDKLHDDRLPNVNGNFNHENEWCGWQDMTSERSYADDVLHILPYVHID